MSVRAAVVQARDLPDVVVVAATLLVVGTVPDAGTRMSFGVPKCAPHTRG